MRLVLTAATELVMTDFDAPGLHVEGTAGGEGYGPLQMFAASLAWCTAHVLLSYDENVIRAGLRSARLTLRWTYADKPYRVGSMALDVSWPGLPEDRVQAAKRAVASCTIHHTLRHPPELTTTVRR